MGKSKYNVKELKRITNKIVEEQKDIHGIDVNAFPVTFIEYYTDYVFKGKFSLNRISDYIYPLNLMGFYGKGDIVIFLNRVEKIKKIDFSKGVVEFLDTVYHELRHSIQKSALDISYEKYIFFLEKHLMIERVKEFDYLTNHDEFLIEIDANLYGIRNASEYLKKYEPEMYEEKKEYMERLEKKYIFDYNMYDASRTFDLAVTVMRNQYRKDGISCETIFMNENGTFKSIKDILDNPLLNTIDKRVVALIMSSETFLKEADFSELTYDYLKLFSLILKYTKSVYINQLNYLDQALQEGIINKDLYKIKKDDIINNINIMDYYIDRINLYMDVAFHIEKRK